MSEKKDLDNTLLLPIPDDKQPKRGWKLYVNGSEVKSPIASVQLVNGRFGTLTYALDPAGYDRWGFREIGGGRAVIVPFAVAPGNRTLIGVVEQERKTQGGMVLNVPRGFLAPGESHFEAAGREFKEEFGVVELAVSEIPGTPTNPNSAFFETCMELPDGSRSGVRFYSVRFAFSDLEAGPHPQSWRLRDGVIKPSSATASSKLVEQIIGCRFIRWHEAVQLDDQFTVAGVGRLMGRLAL